MQIITGTFSQLIGTITPRNPSTSTLTQSLSQKICFWSVSTHLFWHLIELFRLLFDGRHFFTGRGMVFILVVQIVQKMIPNEDRIPEFLDIRNPIQDFIDWSTSQWIGFGQIIISWIVFREDWILIQPTFGPLQIQMRESCYYSCSKSSFMSLWSYFEAHCLILKRRDA